MADETPKPGYLRKLETMQKLASSRQLELEKDWPELSKLVQKFSEFAGQYIRSLTQLDSKGGPRTNGSIGIEKLLQDWSIISRACEQRSGSPDGELQRKIKEATEIVEAYRQRWLVQPTDQYYAQLTNPVIYFEKLYGISRSRYAPEIPVISIPLTDYDDNMHWQALAHEFGHHLFWNAVASKQLEELHDGLYEAVAKKLQKTKQPERLNPTIWVRNLEHWQKRMQLVNRWLVWGRWLEEVFAEMCGTLLEGSAYVISAIELAQEQIEANNKDLTTDDHEHPCHYLRPLIALKVLQEMVNRRKKDEAFKAWVTDTVNFIKQQENYWKKLYPDANELTLKGTDLTLAELEADIEPVVQALLEAKVWPGQRSLGELVRFNDAAVRKEGTWAPLKHSPTRLDEGKVTELGEGIELGGGSQEIVFPDALKDIGEQWQTKLKQAGLSDEKIAGECEVLLLGLGLTETHFHYILHTWPESHCPWCQSHFHDPQAPGPVWC